MSDLYRASLLEREAIDLKIRYVKSCSRCNGKGRIPTEFYDMETLSFQAYPCWCTRKYIYVLDLLIAGVKEEAAVDILKCKQDELLVTEINIKNKKEYDNTKLYKHHLRKYVRHYKDVIKNGYSYIFIGVNGTGKTHAALWILHNFLKMGCSGHYIKFRKLMKLINRNIASTGKDRNEAERFLDEILKVDLLIVDELGRETGNREHIASEIDEVLKDRDMARLPTIVITNRDFDEIEDLYEGGSSLISSAFMRNYKLFIFDPDNDFRKKCRQENWFEK
jgi:DNA replication protein DnaC